MSYKILQRCSLFRITQQCGVTMRLREQSFFGMANNVVSNDCNRNHGYAYTSSRSYFVRRKRDKIYTKELEFDPGDLSWDLPDVDLNAVKPGFENIPNLDNADENVKKVFSLATSDSKTVLTHRMAQLIKKVQRDPLDTNSLEVKIAALTLLIRNQMKHALAWRKDTKSIGSVRVRIKHRNYLLGELRKVDTERYEWLCKELNLHYRIILSKDELEKPSKADVRREAARKKFEEVREQKLVQLDNQLQAARKEFDERKAKELAEIAVELKELGIEDMSSMEAVFTELGLEDMLDKPVKPVRRRKLVLEQKFITYTKANLEKAQAKAQN